MLSPLAAVTAGVLVFASAGALLVAQQTSDDAVTPGAELQTVEPTWVTGTGFWAPSCSGPESAEVDGNVTRERGYVCEPTRNEASDPRLTAEGSWRWNADVYQTEEGPRVVIHGAEYLYNEDGGWTCPIHRLAANAGVNPDQYGDGEIQLCTGTGGYEGLSAMLVWPGENSSSSEFVGLIYSGEVPPLPEPPTVE